MKYTWRLDKWNAKFSTTKEPMTRGEIEKAIKFLRKNYYPIPEDCPKNECPKNRPACKITCYIAVRMCGDF